MSREIKYRVKVTWCDEPWIADVTHITIGHWAHGVTTGKAFINLNGWENEYVDFEISPATGDVLMQSSGLLDKNGVEIYEDYITKNHDGELCRVSRINGCFYSVLISDDCTHELLSDNSSLCEVIGNIYENADLLEASNE